MVMACERDAFLLSRGQMVDVSRVYSRERAFFFTRLPLRLLYDDDDEDRTQRHGKRRPL